MHQLDRDVELVRLEGLLEALNDQLAAIAARLLQLLAIDEVLDDVKDVVEFAYCSQLVAAKFEIGAGEELNPDLQQTAARQTHLVAQNEQVRYFEVLRLLFFDIGLALIYFVLDEA